MRRYHRIISFIAGIFLLIVSTTGVLLHMREFLEEEKKEQRPETAQNLASTLSAGMPAEWTSALGKGLSAIHAQAPTARITRIRIDLEGAEPRLTIQTFGAAESEPRMNYIIGLDGRILKAMPQEKNFLLRLHTGEIIGDSGEVLNAVMGAGLVILVLTGGVLLWEMFRAAPTAQSGLRRIFGLKAKE